jgi:hypothetical protein
MRKLTWISIPVSLILLYIVEWILPQNPASLLPALSLVTAMVQGVLVFLAAAELSHGKWHTRIKDFLLHIHPLLYLFPFAFLILGRNLTFYPWYSSQPIGWLSPNFMIWRNFLVLFLTAVTGSIFSKMALRGSKWTGRWAVFYVLTFVLSNTLIGIDWVMSLEYPWISTMFPALYFVEGGILGVTATILFLIFTGLAEKEDFRKVMRDYALLLMGFGLFWGGLQYAQFLTIWYGNLPEEVAFYFHRLHDPTLKNLILLVLFMDFIVPFIGLIPKKVKTMIPYVGVVAVLVILGLLIERYVHVQPVAEIQVFKMIMEILILWIPLGIYFYESRKQNSIQ